MWGVTWVERRSQLWIEVCLGLLPHICLLPKTLASGLKAGPHQATSTPRFIDFRPCLLTAIAPTLAGSLKPRVGVPVVFNSLPKDDQHFTNPGDAPRAWSCSLGEGEGQLGRAGGQSESGQNLLGQEETLWSGPPAPEPRETQGFGSALLQSEGRLAHRLSQERLCGTTSLI